jgi:hypothetical protein
MARRVGLSFGTLLGAEKHVFRRMGRCQRFGIAAKHVASLVDCTHCGLVIGYTVPNKSVYLAKS